MLSCEREMAVAFMILVDYFEEVGLPVSYFSGQFWTHQKCGMDWRQARAERNDARFCAVIFIAFSRGSFDR